MSHVTEVILLMVVMFFMAIGAMFGFTFGDGE